MHLKNFEKQKQKVTKPETLEIVDLVLRGVDPLIHFGILGSQALLAPQTIVLLPSR